MSTYIQQKYVDLFNDEAKGRAFVEEVWHKGYAVLLDFLTPDTKAKIGTLIHDRSVGNKKNAELAHTIAKELSTSDEMMKILDTIHRHRASLEGISFVPLKTEKQSWGFPYKDARGGAKTEQTHFHFDAAYTNTLIPFVLPPTESGEGHLLIYPNLRRRFKVFPFIGKVLARILRDVPFSRHFYPGVLVPYTVGGFHFFFGDVTFHGVLPIKTGERLVMTINSHW
jgi:hypothetical protein